VCYYAQEPAKRRSGNRPRGTLITKTMTVDRDTMRSYLIGKVLWAIKTRWPADDVGRTIWIQQDNARTHVSVDDEDFARAAAQTGFDIRLINQPPNSCLRSRIFLLLFSQRQIQRPLEIWMN